MVENPATSSPGLAFVLSTIIRFGESGDYTWLDYWRDLRANNVLVVADWNSAYYNEFSGGAGAGDRPLVVSYATSPAAEIFFADPQPTPPPPGSIDSPTGNVDDGCFRQIEFAAVLAGASNPAAAQAWVDYMASPEFQSDMPLNMFVFPVNPDAHRARPVHAIPGQGDQATDHGPGNDRGQPRQVDPGVDGHGSALSVNRPRLSTPLLAALPLAFLGVFFVYPVVSILALGLAPGGNLDIGAALAVLGQPFVLDVVWFTLWQAALSTLLTVLIALPGAYVFARFDFPGRRLISALAIVPFVLPTVVVAAAFLALLGSRSPFGIRLDHSIFAIIAAHVFYNYAVVLRVVGGVWAQIDPRLEDAARVLGASRWQAFRRVTLPLLRPAIASAASVVFLFTFTSFGVILLLGGVAVLDARGRDLPADRRAAQPAHCRRPVAAPDDGACRTALCLLALPAAQRGPAAAAEPSAGRAEAADAERACARRRAICWSWRVLLGVPLAVLVERSLAGPDGYGLQNFHGPVRERASTRRCSCHRSKRSRTRSSSR